jgi:hypothetical protein
MNYPTREQAEALAKCSQTDLCPQTCKAREWCDMDDTVTEKGYLNMHDALDAKDKRIHDLSVMLKQVQASLQWFLAHGGLGYQISGVIETRIDEIHETLHPKDA